MQKCVFVCACVQFCFWARARAHSLSLSLCLSIWSMTRSQGRCRWLSLAWSGLCAVSWGPPPEGGRERGGAGERHGKRQRKWEEREREEREREREKVKREGDRGAARLREHAPSPTLPYFSKGQAVVGSLNCKASFKIKETWYVREPTNRCHPEPQASRPDTSHLFTVDHLLFLTLYVYVRTCIYIYYVL